MFLFSFYPPFPFIQLFVPALEIIADDLKLSNDVAGATLMAAGGSAPELATSFVGAFKRSDVGFGTIVGSAVFNVLFVIAMCVMYTPDKYAPLKLTWFPLFRDCSYYTITLASLAWFMHDGFIETYEAVLQLALYFIYVYMMSKSELLEAWITSKISANPRAIAPSSDGEDGNGDGLDDTFSKEDIEMAPNSSATVVNLNKPSTFRVGLFQLMKSKMPLTETAGIAFISQIKGDVNEVFSKIDTNQNGQIDVKELKQCLLDLGTPEEELGEEAVQAIMKDIDKNGNGHANKYDFTIWYTGNEIRLKNKTKDIFEKYSSISGDKNSIGKKDIVKFMAELGHDDSEAVLEAIKETLDSIETPTLTYDQFLNWYQTSLFWESEKANAEQAAEAQESMWESILSGFEDIPNLPLSAKMSFFLTLPLSLICCLIPDCRPPGNEGYAPATLLCSIAMIAVYSIGMVELAEIFGHSAGIPDVVMGLTILAAGTSVPDLLSSVIVAKQGEGDMAVSSSIGSNIFDVAFGLPLPWLCFNIMTHIKNCACPVRVSGSVMQLVISICTLLGMVAAIILIIMYYKWEMTKGLGGAMFLLYFAYLAFALLQPDSDWSTPCDE